MKKLRTFFVLFLWFSLFGWTWRLVKVVTFSFANSKKFLPKCFLRACTCVREMRVRIMQANCARYFARLLRAKSVSVCVVRTCADATRETDASFFATFCILICPVRNFVVPLHRKWATYVQRSDLLYCRHWGNDRCELPDGAENCKESAGILRTVCTDETDDGASEAVFGWNSMQQIDNSFFKVD